MELTGKILQIGTTKEFGTKGFKKRDLVIQTSEQYPQKVLIEFIQDKCQILDRYKKEDQVKIGINIKGREWTNDHNQKKFFNSIQGWKIESNSSIMQEATEAVTNAQHNPDREPAEVADDLPF